MKKQEKKIKKKIRENRRARKGNSRPQKKNTPAAALCPAGVYSSSGRGYGFFEADDKEKFRDDLFVPPHREHDALDGDRIVVRVSVKNGRREAEVVKITERANKTVTGCLVHSEDGRWQILPQNRHIDAEIYVKAPQGASEGDLVTAEITRFPQTGRQLDARVIKNYGRSDTRAANYSAIIEQYGIPTEFSPDAQAYAESAAGEKLSAAGRCDLRDEIIFTVDGADAKDLDDAVSLSRIADGGYLLGVHIADVSHYVREGSPLDADAMARGTSVYFTDKVIPMLPVCLSNGACSLGAGEDKYALSAFMTLDKWGEIKKTEVKNSIIRSRVRGVYSEMNDLAEKGEGSEYYGKYSQVYAVFRDMLSLYRLLAEKSEKRGALTLDSSESVIILDENGEPADIRLRQRGDCEKLIEQFMLTANEGVARLMSDAMIPCVYRIHENPDPEKMRALLLFSDNLGIDRGSFVPDKPVPAALCGMLENASEKGLSSIFSGVLLRSLMKAKYSEKRSVHFGLALDYYCHFTSPIRRYPDLSVHRILKSYIASGNAADTVSRYSRFALRSAKLSSENELRAMGAERDIESLYKVLYLSRRIGMTFDAVIDSVTSFGIFAELDNGCEGLILLSKLDGDFEYDGTLYTLSSKDKKYSLGDRLRIRVDECDLVRRRALFSIADREEN